MRFELTTQTSGLPVGKKTPALVFLAGFPDDHGSWLELAPRFNSTHSIVVTCMPDYDKKKLDKPWGYGFEEIVDMLSRVINKHTCESESVTLVAHDWGAFVAILYANKYPDAIKNLITLDVGLGAPIGLVTVTYQLWLAIAFIFSQLWLGTIGDLMMLLFPWKLIGPCPYETKIPKRLSGRPGSYMCYPYFQLWKMVLFGKAPTNIPMPAMPYLYVFGKNKRSTFHGTGFLEKLSQRSDCCYKMLDCGHFIQVQKPDELETEMRSFLGI
ncbi:hypothetical protein CYMTET_10377 [Cymbomonas tetramitiformis]|uniref:AB hydrolase-1 domain-containing protein n=1 Tax=Cymbomonas tetramitiformis TaxID=36881 RepID=A0AAE0GQV4_9CHLO|nr:hypothetical protein CYMTET_10377 [Cymbomonas tetramitiformis]|eukprot:gene17251-20525_t